MVTLTAPGTGQWVAVLSLAGDFDSDGDVEGADFFAWQRGFGDTCDASDLSKWQSNFGATAGGAIVSVPEPGTVMMLTLLVPAYLIYNMKFRRLLMSKSFRVGLTRDFLKPDGTLSFGDIGLGVLDKAANVDWEFLEENTSELSQDNVRDYDAILVLAPSITDQTLASDSLASGRLKIVARFGVGYDNVDVEACTRNGVLLTITPDGVRRPVAVTVITFLLALTHKLLIKDRLVRENRWGDKLDHVGIGVTDKTLGIVGLGNIGREVSQLAAPFGLRQIAYDPFLSPESAAEVGVALTSLETLMSTADYVCICCALTDETYHLINAQQLGRMKSSAYLINVARGPIVDQLALTDALRNRRIQGAGLDVFEKEPPDPNDPLFALDNVILSPHALCWTDESFAGIGKSACQAIVDVSAGRLPRYIVNKDVVGSVQLRASLE